MRQTAFRQINKTADYTIKPASDPNGATFTNAGASGAVVFTLPTPNAGMLGWWYDFVGLADQNITVAAPTADTLIAINDLTADSVALSTAGQKIGGSLRARCVRSTAYSAVAAYRWVVTPTTNAAAGTVAT
jgi:hypothetical protein